MRPNNNNVLNGALVNANQASVAQWSTDIVRVTFQAVVTGTPTGNIKIQGSNDYAKGLPPNQFQPTNWSDVGSSVAVAAAGVFLIPSSGVPQECSYQYIRLIYTDTSGGTATGTITARMESKAL